MNSINFNSFKHFLLNNKEEVIDFLKKGNKIHIKKSLEGSFTKYCGGTVTEECIRRGKNSPDPKIRRKATFAQNSRGWAKNKKK